MCIFMIIALGGLNNTIVLFWQGDRIGEANHFWREYFHDDSVAEATALSCVANDGIADALLLMFKDNLCADGIHCSMDIY